MCAVHMHGFVQRTEVSFRRLSSGMPSASFETGAPIGLVFASLWLVSPRDFPASVSWASGSAHHACLLSGCRELNSDVYSCEAKLLTDLSSRTP